MFVPQVPSTVSPLIIRVGSSEKTEVVYSSSTFELCTLFAGRVEFEQQTKTIFENLHIMTVFRSHSKHVTAL